MIRIQLAAVGLLLALGSCGAANATNHHHQVYPFEPYTIFWELTTTYSSNFANWTMRGPNDVLTVTKQVDKTFGTETVYVEHMPLRNVTLQMLGFFSYTIDNKMVVNYNGVNISTYLLYHPLAHVNGIYSNGKYAVNWKPTNKTYTYIKEEFLGMSDRSFANCSYDYLVLQTVSPSEYGWVCHEQCWS